MEAFAPGLAVVLVGGRRDSATYVRMKKRACDEIGITSFGFDFPDDVTQDVSVFFLADGVGVSRAIGFNFACSGGESLVTKGVAGVA